MPLQVHIIKQERKVFDVIIPIMSQDVEHHLPETCQYVPMVACEYPDGLQQLCIITGGDSKIGLNQIAEGVGMKAPIALPIKSLNPEKMFHLSLPPGGFE